ncbi:MAG: hypothetical protein ACI910_001274 [Oleispira sp.]|jgi:hypothetical protein
MSLVNDVLRQLDANSVKPCQALPLHSLMIEQPAKKNKLLKISFILLVSLLFFILTLQIFYKRSLADIFYSNDVMTPQQLLITEDTIESDDTSKENFEIDVINSRLIANKPIERDIMKFKTFKVKTIKNTLGIKDTLRIKNDRMAIIDDSSKYDAVKKEFLIQDVEVNDIKIKNADITKTKIKKTDIKNKQEYKSAFTESNTKKVNITEVENIGFKYYQLSLKAYKYKQTPVALSWIDLALATEKKDEYLRLKVRILMQKGERAELHRFVLAQHDNTSLDWFQLVAPSLQLYAYYDLSNKYYSELIKQQPNDVKWQLAMALNYAKLEQNAKTYSIYKDLLSSSLLTYQQQRWINKRLDRIEQGKVAINER